MKGKEEILGVLKEVKKQKNNQELTENRDGDDFRTLKKIVKRSRKGQEKGRNQKEYKEKRQIRQKMQREKKERRRMGGRVSVFRGSTKNQLEKFKILLTDDVQFDPCNQNFAGCKNKGDLRQTPVLWGFLQKHKFNLWWTR